MYGIAPRLPWTVTRADGVQATKTVAENTKQNLKNLLLTAPGERVMDPNFGVGMRNYLFEQGTNNTIARLEGAIIEQVETYMPFLDLGRIDIGMADDKNLNLLQISISYSIAGISSGEILNVSIDPKLNR